jgi:hypothetical protein
VWNKQPKSEITSLVQAIGDLMQVIKDVGPADKAEIYSQLGLTLTYHPNEKRVVAEARPPRLCTQDCVRGDLNTHSSEISPVR